MSIVALKKKSVVQYGTHISGKSPGGTWIPRGPGFFTTETNNNGFSLNGTHRNKGAIGTSMAFSKTKTLFRGRYAIGWGGLRGTYYDVPLYNVNQAVIVPGTQYKYVKQTVLTTRGMLRTKYKWAYNGQFPNYWVKNMYVGPMVENASQGVYINSKTSANMCKIDTHMDQGTFNESQYIQRLTHRCADPLPFQKHLPSTNVEPKALNIICAGGSNSNMIGNPDFVDIQIINNTSL
jgi:hypothetical protein